MTKLRLFFVVIGGAVLILALDIFVAPTISARLATLSFVRSFQLFSPQAPIVITKQEIIRSTDSTDAVDTIDALKSKVVGIAKFDGGSFRLIGSGAFVTSDGVVLSGAVIPAGDRLDLYRVVSDSGTLGKVLRVVNDPASALSFIVTDQQNAPVVDFASDSAMAVGTRVVAVQHGMLARTPRASFGVVRQLAEDTSGVVFDADRPTGFVPIAINESLVPGSVVVNDAKQVVAFWDGVRLLDPAMVESALRLFVVNQQSIQRPQFGFLYSVMSSDEANLFGETAGALVVSVNPGSPAAQLKLKAGDVITHFKGVSVTSAAGFEDQLLQVKPGDVIEITVKRGAAELVLKLVTRGMVSN